MIGLLPTKWGCFSIEWQFDKKNDSTPLISWNVSWNYDVLLRLAGRHLAQRMRSEGLESWPTFPVASDRTSTACQGCILDALSDVTTWCSDVRTSTFHRAAWLNHLVRVAWCTYHVPHCNKKRKEGIKCWEFHCSFVLKRRMGCDKMTDWHYHSSTLWKQFC